MNSAAIRMQARPLPWWTWVLPGLVCHLGTRISLLTLVDSGVSATYLPIPLGLVMACWWGPRILPGLYLNALLSAGLWGLPNWQFWPLYALPETVAVFLGWWLFEKAGRGRCWLPDLVHTLKFVLLAILPAAIVNGFYVTGQLVLLGDVPGTRFWPEAKIGGIAVLLDGLAFAVPLGVFVTPALERLGLCRTNGARNIAFKLPTSPGFAIFEICSIFAGVLAISLSMPLHRNWSLYGIFALWAALRHGIYLSLAATLWLEFLVILLPAFLSSAAGAGATADYHNLQMALVILCLAGLFTSRTIADQREEIEHRKRTELALKESEECLQVALAAARMGTWSWNLQTNKVDWSAESERIFGLAPGTFAGTFEAYLRQIHPDDATRVKAHIENTLAGAQNSFFNAHRIIRPDGSVRWMEAWGEVQRDAAGKPTGMLGMVVDATTQIGVQRALRSIVEGTSATGQEFFEALARALAEALNVSHVIVARVEGPANEHARSLALWSNGRLQPEMVYNLEGTPCQSVAAREVCFFKTGVSQSFPDDRTLVDLKIDSYLGVPIFDSKQKVVGLLSAFHDGPINEDMQPATILRIFAARAGAEIERLQTYEALRASEARLSAILENTPNVAIQLWDLDGCVQLWNSGSEKVFGFTREEALGRRAEELIMDGAAAYEFRALLQRIASSGESYGPAEYRFNRKDGTEGLCISSIFLVPGQAGRPLIACVDVDVTTLRRLEGQLQHAQKMDSIGRLAGGVAHDFNNLLTGIIGYSDLVLADPTPHPRRRNIEEIRKIGVRAGNLTRQLLSFSRQQVVEPRQLDLNEVVGEMRKMLHRLIEGGIELQFKLRPEPVNIIGDPSQVEQVLLNLIVNARDASGGQGRILVETFMEEVHTPYQQRGFDARPGRYAGLLVRDWGTGMTEDILDHVFEPYFTTKPTGKGTGLGLSMVFGIVKKCGGFVTIDTVPGAGSTFRIWLPEARQAVQVEVAAAAVVRMTGQETILLVDDEETILDVVASGLRAKGYRVLEARHPDLALKLATEFEGPIHLLVTDIVLPRLSGPRLAEAIRALRPELRVLFTSGYTEDETVLHGVSQRAINFLEKPFNIQQLTEKVRGILAEGSAPAGQNGAAPLHASATD